MDLTQALATEFGKRRERSPRYSLRAYARDLEIDHASLSQLLRGRRVLSPRLARKFGAKLQLSPADIREACEELNARAILRLARVSGFRPNSRWIATHTGLPVDAVNVALTRLLHQRALRMESSGRWKFSSPPHA